MYYEEQIINGVLYCRSAPDGEWRNATTPHAAAVNALLSLDNEGRLDAMRSFCPHCGSIQPSSGPNCQCWNDD